MLLKALVKSLNLNFIFKLNSIFWKFILKTNNIKVGKDFYIEGAISLKLKGSKNNPVIIYDNVSIFGDIDLRTREDGQIKIKKGVIIDTNIRLVAARSAILSIGENTRIGCNTIINAGANLTLEKNCLVGANCSINSSDHKIEGKADFLHSGYYHSPITIEKGCWLGTNVVILPGIKIGKGSVIGASSVVTKDIPSYSISVGIPSKVIKKRI
tara:strand:- start:426 stop:1061 length:636 start_codon:yes stop_codon:yes gene_type:complete